MQCPLKYTFVCVHVCENIMYSCTWAHPSGECDAVLCIGKRMKCANSCLAGLVLFPTANVYSSGGFHT